MRTTPKSVSERLQRFWRSGSPIWPSIAERLIGQVKPKAYLEASGYLRQMHKVYKRTGRLDDWKALLQRLRVEQKAKRRLMEVLDGLEKNQKLVERAMKNL